MTIIDTTPKTLTLLAALTLGLAACGDSGPVTGVPDATTTLGDDGVFTTQINASDDERWVVFDFEDPKATGLTEDSPGWDLAFRRVDIRAAEGVEVATLRNLTLEEVDGVPTDDQFVSDDGEDYAFSDRGNWYNYNIVRHRLSPKDRTYVVRSSEGTLYKLAITNYYDDEDRSGFPEFRWAVLDGTGTIGPGECVLEEAIAEVINPQTAVADASLETAADGEDTLLTLDVSLGGTVGAATSSYAYIDLNTLQLLELDDIEAATDASWHIAVKRTEWRVNSADSGPGAMEVASVEGTPFASAAMPEASDAWRPDDFMSDECEVQEIGRGFLDTAVGQWYDYDFMTHTVSVKQDPLVYFVRDGATGGAWRFMIETYDAGVYGIRFRAE